MRQEAPWTHLGKDILIKFQPGLVALAVRVLQPEEPDLPQPYRFHHLSNMIFEPFSNLLCMFTWSKSCLPVVLGWMANSSSASIVVTRTFTGFGILRLLKSCSERRISDPETLRLRDCWTPFFLDQLFFQALCMPGNVPSFQQQKPFWQVWRTCDWKDGMEARGGEIYVVKAVAAGGGEDDAQHCP